MSTIECGYCGKHVEVDPLDNPPQFVEQPADERHPRRFVILGGRSSWLLHRCDISEVAEIDVRDAAVTGLEVVKDLFPA